VTRAPATLRGLAAAVRTTWRARVLVLLCIASPIALAVELRVRAASLPVVGRMAPTLAIRDAKALAMAEAASLGLEEDAFVRRALARLRELERSPQLRTRALEIARRLGDASRDADGTPYLLGTDPYRWLRRARNLARTGSFGEERRGRRAWNALTGVHGLPADANLQALAVGSAAWLVRPIRGPSLERIHYWSPVVVCALALIPVYLVGARLAGPLGGLLGASYVALLPLLFQRTTAGYSDTDAWNLMLPCLVCWLLLDEAPPRTDAAGGAARVRWRAAVLAGLAMGIFAWNWAGWWFYLIVFAAGLAASLAVDALIGLWRRLARSPRETRPRAPAPSQAAVTAATFVLATALGVLAIAGWPSLTALWREPMAALGMLRRARTEAWPNPYVTVGELQPADFATLQDSVGGIELWVAAALGIVALVVSRRRTARTAGLVMAAWMMIGLVATTRGARFLVMLGPPVALGVGALLARLALWGWAGRRPPRRGRLAVLALVIAIAASSLFLLRWRAGQYAETEALLPDMNDAWAEDFAWLRVHASRDAIVCGWWDYGDMVTAEAGRRVLFDAGSQVSSTAYWIGRALAAEEPAQSLGVLRMLCLGGDRSAYEALRRAGLTPQRSVSVLGEAARLAEPNRSAMLAASGVEPAVARRVVEALSGQPPEAYLWLTEDLTWKAHAWGRYGRWDFRKAALYEATVGMRPREAIARANALGIGPEEAMVLLAQIARLPSQIAVNEWIAPGPIVARPAACVAHPRGLVTDGGLVLPRPVPGPTGMIRSGQDAAAVYERNGLLWAAAIPPELSRSLYVRLMYESSAGIGPFERVHEGETRLGERTALYRIRWP
jgi:dolichyl-phosphooligosaccharide-protein glycotransferase